jgi:hypothetical protein
MNVYRYRAIRWRCLACGNTFVSYDKRHTPHPCDCRETWVDHEDVYIRTSLDVDSVADGWVVELRSPHSGVVERVYYQQSPERDSEVLSSRC